MAAGEPTGPLRGKRAVLLDLDGVVYAGEKLLPGAGQAVEALRASGVEVRFLSNNSLKKPESIVAKLVGLGVPCSDADVFTSGHLACMNLRHELPGGARVLVVGTDELRSMVEEQGLTLDPGPEAQAVLVGMTREFGYGDILNASRAIKNGARFYACNQDGMYLGEGEQYFPGCGAMVGAVAGAVGHGPERSFGKPDPRMLREAIRIGGWKNEDCIMVGDTWTSDVAMAEAARVDWIYVGRETVECPASRRFDSLSRLVELCMSAAG